MISDDDSLKTLSKKWKGPSFWSPALGRRGGVAILCSPRQREHISFWQSLAPYFFPNSQLILAGDFNCNDGSLDKMGGSISIDARLTDLKSTNFLRDA